MGIFDFMRGRGRLTQDPTVPQLYQQPMRTPETMHHARTALNNPQGPQYVTTRNPAQFGASGEKGPVSINPLPPMAVPDPTRQPTLTPYETYMKQVDEYSKFSNAPLSDKLIALGRAFRGTGGAEYAQNYTQGIRQRFEDRYNRQNRQEQLNQRGKIEYVGDSQQGKLVKTNELTGTIEDITDQVPPSVLEAYKAKAGALASKGRAINPTTGRPINKAEEATDKRFGKQLIEDPKHNLVDNITKMSQALVLLSGPDAYDYVGTSFSNPLKTAARYIDPQGDLVIRAAVDAKSKDLQDLINSVTQQNLRATLGAQFTAREGFMLIARAYDPRLSPEFNARRVAVAREMLLVSKKHREAQENYFAEHGTLAGFKSPVSGSLDQLDARMKRVFAETDPEGETPAAPADQAIDGLDELLNKYQTN